MTLKILKSASIFGCNISRGLTFSGTVNIKEAAPIHESAGKKILREKKGGC